MLVPKESEASDLLRKIDVNTALQYGTAQGYPALYSWLRHFTREHLHPSIPYTGGPDIILTCGSTDGFSKALQLLHNEWSEEKDWVREREGMLVEKYTYMSAVQAALPRGMNVVPVDIDDQGMIPYGEGSLEDILSNWDTKKGKRPHLMYIVTIGQNPTGTVMGLERRKEIYGICSKYDVVIIEDDPYWYLQYPSAFAAMQARSENLTPTSSHFEDFHQPELRAPSHTFKSSGFDFLDSLVPSFLSIDADGRILRLDTFSKTTAPGCRLGWITAQPAFIERLLRITESTTQQPSGFVQSMVAELLMGPETAQDGGRGGAKDGSGWKVDGWVRWLEGMRGNYERRMNTMGSILEEGRFRVQSSSDQSSETTGAKSNSADDKFDTFDNASTDAADQDDSDDDEWHAVDKVQMYTFDWPAGGMFLWLKVDFSTHPLVEKVALKDLSQALWFHFLSKPYRVLMSPGTMFSPTKTIAETTGCMHFRLCFAAVDEEDVAIASHNIVAAFNSFWEKTKIDDPEDVEAGFFADSQDDAVDEKMIMLTNTPGGILC
ncbi:PLP-dependent transferase [Xylona heveae TC161]|uniref:PLP-dependent transferase n=1 Tax=Xylona heveae (strain CBS 132557 / TC161) TaxID=1328760 RepID=A0A165A9X9_XYLHT|nr:PLP-dependent transferase [Xylona heveae TC161]KZF20148.1 PLP-dependent transferase [Xylona heveae TC161]